MIGRIASLITISFYKRVSFVALLSGISLCNAYAQGYTPLDFDGDGESDILTTVASGTDLKWSASGSSSAVREVDAVFGLAADGPAPASWFTSEEPALGVVRLSSNSRAINWRALKADGTLASRNFGEPNDLTISGGDFNGNGLADAAVVRVRKGALIWGISHDHLADDPGRVRKLTFGVGGDRAFILKVDGELDWIGVLGKRGGGRSVAIVRSLLSKRRITIRGLPRALTSGDRPRPIPLIGPDGSGILAFVTLDSTDSVVAGYSLRGKRLSRTIIAGSGAQSVGDFLPGEPGEEIAIQTSANVTVINPASGVKDIRSAVGERIVGAVNVNVVAGLPTPTPAPTVTAAPTNTPDPTATPE